MCWLVRDCLVCGVTWPLRSSAPLLLLWLARLPFHFLLPYCGLRSSKCSGSMRVRPLPVTSSIFLAVVAATANATVLYNCWHHGWVFTIILVLLQKNHSCDSDQLRIYCMPQQVTPSLQPLTTNIFLALIAATANATGVPYNSWHHGWVFISLLLLLQNTHSWDMWSTCGRTIPNLGILQLWDLWRNSPTQICKTLYQTGIYY